MCVEWPISNTAQLLRWVAQRFFKASIIELLHLVRKFFINQTNSYFVVLRKELLDFFLFATFAYENY